MTLCHIFSWQKVWSGDFILQMHWWCYNISNWWFFLSQGNQWKNALHNPKYGDKNLACWCLCLWSLWMAFTCCCPLSWLPIWLWSEVMDPLFIHCHIFRQRLLFVVLKQLQTTLWMVDALFLIDCQQTRHLLWTQLSHWQIFMQNGEYTAFWYPQLLCYLTQFQFMIGQNEFVEFFGVFQDNCRIWVTRVFSIIWVCTIAFKVSIPPLNHCFWWSRLRLILIKQLLCLNSIFSPSESNALSTHEIQIFPLFKNFVTVALLK